MCPQRDSNPRYHLERVATWAASRWGRPSEDTRGRSYHPWPPGRLAQLVERLPYTQVAAGSSPAPPILSRVATRPWLNHAVHACQEDPQLHTPWRYRWHYRISPAARVGQIAWASSRSSSSDSPDSSSHHRRIAGVWLRRCAGKPAGAAARGCASSTVRARFAPRARTVGRTRRSGRAAVPLQRSAGPPSPLFPKQLPERVGAGHRRARAPPDGGNPTETTLVASGGRADRALGHLGFACLRDDPLHLLPIECVELTAVRARQRLRNAEIVHRHCPCNIRRSMLNARDERRAQLRVGSVWRAAVVCGCRPSTVRRAVLKGDLPAWRAGDRGMFRIAPDDLEAWMAPIEPPGPPA